MMMMMMMSKTHIWRWWQCFNAACMKGTASDFLHELKTVACSWWLMAYFRMMCGPCSCWSMLTTTAWWILRNLWAVACILASNEVLFAPFLACQAFFAYYHGHQTAEIPIVFCSQVGDGIQTHGGWHIKWEGSPKSYYIIGVVICRLLDAMSF